MEYAMPQLPLPVVWLEFFVDVVETDLHRILVLEEKWAEMKLIAWIQIHHLTNNEKEGINENTM